MRIRIATWSWVALVSGLGMACGGPQEQEEALAQTADELRIPNNFPILNAHGLSASFHTEGRIDLENEFFQPQGSNGRHCETCHAFIDGWSIRPQTVHLLFDLTDGTHPIFAPQDADTPTSDVSTVEARRQSYSMLLQGKFTRSVAPPATADYTVIAANDPFGVGRTSRLWFFRRPLPTANFKSHTVMWDGANTVGTDLRAGLIRQARGNVTGAQQGPPATDAVIFEIVDFELNVSHAQRHVWGAGRLDAAGASGGPEAQASQPLVAGPFTIFDAWAGSNNPHRAKIARGQALFNNGDHNGRRCGGCHNAANNGQNVSGNFFNVGTSDPQFKNDDMAVYTFRRNSDGAILESTDPGRGIRSGRFADLNRFKTPNIRGLAARAPYFHNGISETLEELVTHYEVAAGFDFTPQEESDLVAFLSAL